VIELQAIIFKTLYVWMTAYSCYLFSNFLEFLEVFLFFILDWVFYSYMLLGLCAPLAPFYEIELLIK
jgi:hypothetical protein